MKKDYVKIILQIVKKIIYVILYPIFQLFNKERNNEVLFLSDSRDNLTGNFEFVYNEIVKRNKYKVRTILRSKIKSKKTIKERLDFLYYLARSKYVFVDDFYPTIYPIKLKKSKKLIQLWHAMGAYKTVGYARLGKPGGPKGLNLTHRNYTGCIVSSESIRKDYALAFGIDISRVHALGIPRTDIFFDDNYKENIKNSLYEKYPMLKDKKVILFAPTFRGNGQATAHYNFDWFDLNKFKEKYKDEYVCIFKLHPFIKNRPDFDFTNDDFYIDLTSEREINDLLFITDVMITDFSSVIYEYSFFRKPVIFYTPDFDEYVGSRDFFYPFDKYNYGVNVKDFESLLESIDNAKVDNAKIDEFFEYFCSACDGNSTKKAVDYFLGEE